MKFLTQKKAGLPLWAWAAIASALIFGLFILARKRGSSSGNSAPSDAGSASDLNPTEPGNADTGGGDGGGSSFNPFDNGQTDPYPYDYVYPGGGTDFPNVTDAQAPPATTTSGPTTSSPTKPIKSAVKSTSTRYAQTGKTLGATTAPNARVQAASVKALKTAKKQKKDPATAALAARSAGLNAAYFKPKKHKPTKKKVTKK